MNRLMEIYCIIRMKEQCNENTNYVYIVVELSLQSGACWMYILSVTS